MGTDARKADKRFEQVIRAIQEHLSHAEAELARLGGELQFLVGASDLEIVRRGPTGMTRQPKLVVAELKGCDPMLWRPELPVWMRSLGHGGGGEPRVRDEGGGQPAPSGAGEEENGGSKPPESTGGRS